jgi:hypothetical protein
MGDSFDPDENALVKLTSLVVLGVGLTGFLLGYDWFWVVFVVGFVAVVPIVEVVTNALGVGETSTSESGADTRPHRHQTAPDRTADTESEQDALDALRSRYARGELSDAEFERKVEALLETETPESARKHVEPTGTGGSERETEPATER